MQLNEFLEKFLPDTYKKQVIRENGCHTYNESDLIPMFKYALQSFAERLCEEQSKNCADYYEDCIGYKQPDNYIYNGILEAEQPNIEEL